MCFFSPGFAERDLWKLHRIDGVTTGFLVLQLTFQQASRVSGQTKGENQERLKAFQKESLFSKDLFEDDWHGISFSQFFCCALLLIPPKKKIFFAYKWQKKKDIIFVSSPDFFQELCNRQLPFAVTPGTIRCHVAYHVITATEIDEGSCTGDFCLIQKVYFLNFGTRYLKGCLSVNDTMAKVKVQVTNQ